MADSCFLYVARLRECTYALSAALETKTGRLRHAWWLLRQYTCQRCCSSVLQHPNHSHVQTQSANMAPTLLGLGYEGNSLRECTYALCAALETMLKVAHSCLQTWPSAAGDANGHCHDAHLREKAYQLLKQLAAWLEATLVAATPRR